MKIQNLKELQKVIALCKRQGVIQIEIDGVKMVLLEQKPSKARITNSIPEFPEANIKVPQFQGYQAPQHSTIVPASVLEAQKAAGIDDLTEEQILMWSAQGSEQ